MWGGQLWFGGKWFGGCGSRDDLGGGVKTRTDVCGNRVGWVIPLR